MLMLKELWFRLRCKNELHVHVHYCLTGNALGGSLTDIRGKFRQQERR